MSYVITISGHKNTASPEESIEFEKAVADEGRKFVESVKRLSGDDAGSSVSASGSFGHIGYQDLTKAEDAPAVEGSTET